MPRSPSPDRRSDRERSLHRSSSRRDDRDHDRRRSRSPPRRDDEKEGRSRRDDDDRLSSRRDRSRSRDRDSRRRDDRDRSRSRSRDRHHHRSSRRRSPSSSGSDSDDSRRHRRSRRRRSRSRSRSRDRGGREDKDERRRRREEKKERKARREEKKRAKKGLEKVEWGKHGILTDADIYQKSDEFHAWLVGELMVNPETLSKAKEKEHFKQFMEDFNTGTLPHEKYYDIAKYEKQMAAVRMGETVDKGDTYDFNRDLEAAKSAHRRAAPSISSVHNLAQLEALRQVQNDRITKEKMQRLGITPSEKLGVRMEEKYRG